VKRRGPTAIGGKTIAQKVVAIFKKMPAHLQAMVRSDLADAAERTRQHLANAEDGFADEADLHDYSRHAVAFAVLHTLVEFIEQLPGITNVGSMIDAVEQEYEPGGPPQSPVHDSLFTSWVLLDLPFGRKHETIASIAIELAALLRFDPEVRAAIDELAASRLGLYRLEKEKKPRAGESLLYRAREVITDRVISLQFVEAYEVHPPDLVLVRAVELDESRALARGATHLGVITPYVLELTTDAEWLDYFERVASTGAHASKASAYEATMRGAGDPRRWIEYVFVGYVGQREKNVVRVVGIPDKPHTLPHHGENKEAAEQAALATADTRERATLLSTRIVRRLFEAMSGQPRPKLQALADHLDALEQAGGDPDHWHLLVTPVVFYDAFPAGGAPVCTALSPDTLERDELEYLEAARRGFTSIFEVVDVTRGERMRLRDLLGCDEFDVLERSGTLRMPTRVVLFARLVRYRGIWLADGMLPAAAAANDRDRILARVRERLGRSGDASATPLVGAEVHQAMIAWQEAITQARAYREQQPPPRLVAATGEEIARSKATFAFDPAERARVLDGIARLRRTFPDSDEAEPDGTETFVVVDNRDSIEATITVTSSSLTIESNTRGRLARVHKRLEQKIPGVLALRSHDVTSVDEMHAKAVPRTREPPPPEFAAVIAEVIRKHYADLLDSPVPALGGDTPRTVAKDPRRHAELDAFLRDHEHSVTLQHGPGIVDFAKMRRELGLRS
jgi:hypothetical protein